MMRPTLLVLPVLLSGVCTAAATQHKEPCSKSDNAADCKALVDLAGSANIGGWKSKKNWLKDVSVCSWYGVECKDKRVESLTLHANGLSGSLPESLGGLSELRSLDLAGKRPPGYGPHSCLASGATNFNNSAMPRSFYSLSKLSTWSMEYTCIGGTLAPELGSMLALEDILIHGNFISGTLPPEIDNLSNLVQHKLGRNPISGTLPPMLKPKPKLQKYNCNRVAPSRHLESCSRVASLLTHDRHAAVHDYAYAGNFCALTGTFPDVFSAKNFPALVQAYWDGNGFTVSPFRSLSPRIL
jgi:hypothetical protein